MVKTIAIQNPRIIQQVTQEMGHAVGRSATEAAENLIMEAVQSRQVERARATAIGNQPVDSTDARSGLHTALTA